MTADTHEPVMPLTMVEAIATCEGFTPEDFAIFETPDFAERMSALRAHIKPKLTRLGELLAPRLSVAMEEPMFAHVAQHLRRTVNPPEETWVAFARSPRAYKPFTHLRVAISAENVRVTVFVEDYADDKRLFAANLTRNADTLAAYLLLHPTIRAYELLDPNGEPKRAHALDSDTLRAFAERMERVKGQHAVFGRPFASSHPVVQSGPELLEAALDAALILKPLYDCGKPDFVFAHAPEPISR